MKRLRVLSMFTVLLLFVSIGLSACGGDPTATPALPTATARPAATATSAKPAATATSENRQATTDEENLIDEALGNARNLKTYHFNLEIKPSEFITQPVKAEGDYVAPDTVYVKGTAGNKTFENIVIGDTVFEKNSSGDYVVKKEESSDPSDPTQLFDSENIISSGNPLKDIDQFAEGASDLRNVGDVQVDGVRTKHFTFKLDIAKMMGEDAQGMDVTGLDMGGGGFYVDATNKRLYGLEYNINVAAFFELIARAFSGLMGTPTPGGAKPTALPRMDLNMIMKITRHNDTSITVPVTDEMRAMMEEEPTEEPTEDVESTPMADETPVAEETPEADATEDPSAVPTIPGLPSGDGQTHSGKKGEAVDVAWAKVTVNSTKRLSDGVIAPEAGKEFLVVNITVENVSEAEPQNLSSLLMFKLLDSKGAEIEQSLFAEMDNPIDSETPNPLPKGEKVTGDIAYQITKGDSGQVLEFYPFPFFDDNTKASITVDK